MVSALFWLSSTRDGPLANQIVTHGLGAIEPPVAILLLEGEQVGVLVVRPRPDAPVRPDRVPPLHANKEMESENQGERVCECVEACPCVVVFPHLQRRCAAVLPGICLARTLQGIRPLGFVLAMILFRHSSSFVAGGRKEEKREGEGVEEGGFFARAKQRGQQKRTCGDQATRWSLALVGLPFAGGALATAVEEGPE